MPATTARIARTTSSSIREKLLRDFGFMMAVIYCDFAGMEIFFSFFFDKLWQNHLSFIRSYRKKTACSLFYRLQNLIRGELRLQSYLSVLPKLYDIDGGRKNRRCRNRLAGRNRRRGGAPYARREYRACLHLQRAPGGLGVRA
ncbi:hypothetical protein SDC9_195614 [bioreactor metagenome]|uniref:Uncharacterized protein n=1 Tax=bioreactor metagenome TaxID=1076179 RepID=A0A645IA72_9ZZZZ